MIKRVFTEESYLEKNHSSILRQWFELYQPSVKENILLVFNNLTRLKKYDKNIIGITF